MTERKIAPVFLCIYETKNCAFAVMRHQEEQVSIPPETSQSGGQKQVARPSQGIKYSCITMNSLIILPYKLHIQHYDRVAIDA